MRPIATNIVLAVVPSLLIIRYVYRKDRGAKEPRMLVFFAFLLGFFAVIPAILIELLFTEIFNSTTGILYIVIRAFVIAALVEEGTKLAVVRLFLYRRSAFDEFADGILYTITASLGFAFFENILYSFGPTYALIIRGLTAVPLHTAAAGMLGYYIGMSKIRGKSRLGTGLACAVGVHGLYDFLLFTGTYLSWFVIPLLVVSLLVLRTMFKKAQKYDSEQINYSGLADAPG